MKLHLLGLPHTVTRRDYSSCAFTGKIMRMSPMVRSVGYEIIHYGVEGAESGASQQVDVISQVEMESFIGKYDPKDTQFIGRHANAASPLYIHFNKKLKELLPKYAEPGDIILLPFGSAHAPALEGVQTSYFLESGIGYNEPSYPFRVYESQAWLHHIAGKEIGFKNQHVALGNDYNWVIPNYYDLNDWKVQKKKGEYVLFLGRIVDSKGLHVIAEIAKRMPHIDFVLAGHGDPSPFLTSKNIHYVGPAGHESRAELFANAICTLTPSRYFEPFCGVAVESMLCGTPALGSTFGAFTETIQDGVSGFRCRTLFDWIEGIEVANSWKPRDWQRVREYAQNKYDMYKLAKDYDRVFKQISELSGQGWFTPRQALKK